jgi:hypothetical protein
MSRRRDMTHAELENKQLLSIKLCIQEISIRERLDAGPFAVFYVQEKPSIKRLVQNKTIRSLPAVPRPSCPVRLSTSWQHWGSHPEIGWFYSKVQVIRRE